MERSKWCDVCTNNCQKIGGIHDMEDIKPPCYVAKSLLQQKHDICMYVMRIEKPFALSELFKMLQDEDISTNKEMILDIFSELYENGSVNIVGETECGCVVYSSC